MIRNILKKIIIFFSVILLGLYPIYKSIFYGEATSTYKSHVLFLEGNSPFFNPWQYRILSPYMVEGLHIILNSTIYKIDFLAKYFSRGVLKNEHYGKTTEYKKYMITFVIFRLIQNLLIFWLFYVFCSSFVSNSLLINFAIVFISLSIGNSVKDSNFSFNIYTDVICYLLAAIIITKNLNHWLLIPITIIGSLNRETSILIPFLYFNYFLVFRPYLKLPSIKVFLITITSFLFYFLIYFSIRQYFGTQAFMMEGINPFGTFLKNITYSPTWFENMGTSSILPLISIYFFKRSTYFFKSTFLSIVPIWYFIHLFFTFSWESRIFLVPTIVIFIPMSIIQIEKNFNVTNTTK